MKESIYDIIRSAIKNKQQVTATYKEHVRELCPHVIGTKSGRERALFYQFGGTSSQGTITPEQGAWRCLFIEELSNVSTRNGEWFTGANHSRPQSCVDNIDLEVKF
ncbi:hypothetical protein [Comamonas sp. AG1104]|uniref:hypothetical protein n=1 Tax=Comamonas sp. AG1104 TaxID=2183900 RepID=UPI000E0B6378|nr:hypothetical protein [Comamonas sp. AG1104]RDI10543.1 hypothetical protein DFO48_10552 [Comamonas sp. AG1104]